MLGLWANLFYLSNVKKMAEIFFSKIDIFLKTKT